MASSFLGLYVQRDALLLAQKALDITGNNISNIDTKGYSRQRVDIVSVSHARNTLGYNTSVSLAGQGAEALGITQIRDKLLDKKVRNYSGDLCDVGVKVNTLGDIEDIFDSIEADSAEVEASFAAVVNKLKAALQSYTADNADRAEMGNIAMNTAEGLAQALRRYSLDLDKISDETLMDAQKTTDRINAIFAEMGNLNKQIKDSYISMGYIESDTHNYQVQSQYGPLELKDEMNNLLDELAQYGNIEFQEEWDGTFSVKFADQLVVSGKYYAQMATTKLDPEPTELGFIITQTDLKDAWTPVTDDKGVPTKGLYDKDAWYDMNIENKTSGDAQLLVRKLYEERKVDAIDVTGEAPNGLQYLDTGSLRGLLDMYNGRGLFDEGVNSYSGIEYYRDLLNSFAKTLADSFNDVYKDAGVKLFEYGDDFRHAAENLRVSQQWIDNPELVADPSGGNNEYEELDNTYIHKLLALFSNDITYSDGMGHTIPTERPLDKFVSYVNEQVGTQKGSEEGVYNATDIMLETVEIARSEAMDVSMNEEGVNMMNYQKWYNAISRMVSTLDEALDKLINNTGLVGLR